MWHLTCGPRCSQKCFHNTNGCIDWVCESDFEGEILAGREALQSGSSKGISVRTPGRRPWILAWLAFLPLVMIRAENFAESDTFWAIRTGILTISTGAIPNQDAFSWTAAGEHWTLNAWAFNVVIGAAYLLAGLPGTAIVSSFFIALIGALILFQARQLGANPVVAGFVLFIGGALATTWISARPQIIDYAAMLAIMTLLGRLLVTRKPFWVVVWLGLITIAWVNLHAGAPLGAVACGASTLGILLSRPDRRRAFWFLGATLTVGASCLLNPYGFGIVAQTLMVKGQSTNIKEWQPFDAGDPLELVVMAVGVIAVCVTYRRRNTLTFAVLAVMLCGSVVAYRVLPIFFLLSLPVLAAAAPPGVLRYVGSRRLMLKQGAAAGVFIAAAAALVNVQNLGRPDPADFPVSAIGEIPAGCHLYNDYQLGGLVILQRPDVKVSIDSRNDLYGAARVEHSLETIAGHGDIDAAIQGADCALVPPDTGLAAFLRKSSLWTEKFSEPTAALFVRNHQ